MALPFRDDDYVPTRGHLFPSLGFKVLASEQIVVNYQDFVFFCIHTQTSPEGAC